ncbi:MAG: hypothetical protein LQ345_000923 [Seirophora villosa]|nr:MAG: hypothetical protein LQ345_000923 [Seirophora villosa]
MPPLNINMTAAYIPSHTNATLLSPSPPSDEWYDNPYFSNVACTLATAGIFFLFQLIIRHCIGRSPGSDSTTEIDDGNAATEDSTVIGTLPESTIVGAVLGRSHALPMEALTHHATQSPWERGLAESSRANSTVHREEDDPDTEDSTVPEVLPESTTTGADPELSYPLEAPTLDGGPAERPRANTTVQGIVDDTETIERLRRERRTQTLSMFIDFADFRRSVENDG